MSDKTVYEGTVIWFSRSYGFIEWFIGETKQKDLFCHWSDLNMKNYKTLKKGQKVTFTLGLNHHGQPKATDVVLV